MVGDPFGDLRNWGEVLALLDKLTNEGELDAVQPGLVRLIRFRGNWQLRERALICCRQVKAPSPELTNVLLELTCQRRVYLDARILAVNALADLMARSPVASSTDIERLVEVLAGLLTEPEAPVFQWAVERAAGKIRKLQPSLVPVIGRDSLVAVE